MRSVGIDETRQQHTDSPVALDLQPVRQTVATEPLTHAVDDLKERLREYTRKRGFIRGGELQPLDDRYLAARELLHAADIAARSQGPTESEELYVLDLFDGAEGGTWPPETTCPDSLAAARGLAVAEAVDAYRRDLRTWLEDHPDPEATTTLGSLREQIKRIEALQGEVSLPTSNSLVAAARAVGQYLRTGDETALASARDRLQRLR